MALAHSLKLPVEDVTAESPGLGEMMKVLAAKQLIFVPRQTMGPAGGCYHNIAALVAQRGGRMRLGWMLETVPGVWVSAMHHAVWEAPDGGLGDITMPQSNLKRDGVTAFVPDESIPVDLTWPMEVISKHVALSSHPAVQTAIDAYAENKRAVRQQNHILRQTGRYEWDRFRGGFMGPPFPSAAVKQNAILDGSSERQRRAWLEILAHHFPHLQPPAGDGRL